jgi:dTDP-4-dehydrorhamnose reductase
LRHAPAGAVLHLVARRSMPAAVPPGATVHRLDLADAPSLEALFDRVAPALVFHLASTMDAAAFSRDIVQATENVVRATRTKARLLHMSTDLVFDGERGPYRESDALSPAHPYGEAKALAEAAVADLPQGRACRVRTSLILGLDPVDPRTEWMASAIRAGELPLFVDELRCPVFADDLALALWTLAERSDWPPVLHLAGREALSRYALGLLIAGHFGIALAPVRAARSRDLGQRRPRDTRLDCRLAAEWLGFRPRAVSELLAHLDPTT